MNAPKPSNAWPAHAIQACGRVLAFGARKHGDSDVPAWQKPERGAEHHEAAARRHMAAIDRGEMRDPETGELHHIHAALRLLFASWHRGERDQSMTRGETAAAALEVIEQLRGQG